MAYENNQNEYPLPADGKSERRSESLLPRYFRTEANKKFLQSTLDQLIQPGVAEKLNGYYGRQISKAYRADDNYVGDVSTERQNYQFEPAIVARDTLDNVTFYRDYNDYLNQISIFGGNTNNQSVLNSQEYYAWNPSIDFDKFTNFREYFWLPYGPQTIRIAGQSRNIESTVKVSLANNIDNFAYIFSSDELVQNPTLTLYRGQTYTFEIDTVGTPISFRTARSLDSSFNYDVGVSAQGIEKGTITFQVDENAPEALYYVATNDINNSGLIQIKEIEENTQIDVEKEILGKTKYKTEAGLELSNGMKVEFAGLVTPEIYSKHEWYVEGVGDSIVLIKEEDLQIPGAYADDREIPFDTNAFDRLPFDNANGFPGIKDYIVINRASPDRNSWSRYNRWFHRSVIETAAAFNNQDISVDQSQRATRPIIEFDAGLKLYKFGTFNKRNVDLVDTFTTDIFSTVEGAIGYSVDGVPLVNGMRVLFTAEQDILHTGKIFRVEFIRHKGKRQISLVEEQDSNPLENETVLVLNGQEYKGKMFYFDGSVWQIAQDKNGVNQQPLFDLFDNSGVSLQNYDNSNFVGNKIFSYRVGNVSNDSELGFPLSYRSINNIGDLVFDFNLLGEIFTYTNANGETITESTSDAFVQKYKNRTSYQTINGWSKVEGNSQQRVLRQYVSQSNQTDFAIDMFDNSADLNDLNVRVLVNNAIKFQNTHYEIVNINNQATVRFNTALNTDDIVVLKVSSSAEKNENGIYELPYNLERNPKNNDVTTFTLGEVNDHVASIIEAAPGFVGEFPGSGNLRDLGNISVYGEKFLQHSGPINLAAYHLTTKNANIVKAIDFSRKEYAKFKRLFLQTSLDIGYDGNVKTHVDLIFKELNKNKNSNLPFYFSDMVPTGGSKLLEYEVFEEGNIFYALSEPFTLDVPSVKAITVYVNDEQLTYEQDYTFNAEGFCVITSPLVQGDNVKIYEYDTTDGSYVPPTLTKFGMYPKFVPTKFLDSTYVTPTEVIQGHDGSIIKSFGDYRDDLLLELERRIYNNIKVEYNTDIIDIHSFIGGEYRDTAISKSTIDNSMIKDFSNWLEIAGNPDYTDFSFYERSNSFTYNYSSMSSPEGNVLPGYWRAIYKQAYDTDRPHTHPWEMLGFSIKPTWWEDQYGPAPYTSNNLLMWQDLEDGIVADPSAARVVVEKYKRKDLTAHLPVDSQGNLLSPLDSRYAKNYVNRFTRASFKFGDESPTETAWRRSSEYPFSLFKAWILNQPAKIIGLGFDRLRTTRNSAGQLVYSVTNKRLRLEDLVFPSNNAQIVEDRIYTSGFVNFISNYLASNVLINYSDYRQEVESITNQMTFKVGGFTDKSKFNLILDSRTPLNEGNVFIPEENYDIILQTSNPIELVTYSGVVIEKTTAGYTVRGYDAVSPEFKYYKPIVTDKDPLVNVGGISEAFIDWASNKRYLEGTIVRENNRYYRTIETHVSGVVFDGSKFAALPNLPIVGGKSAKFRRSFDRSNVETLAYGTFLKTSQEVVDFLLGYGDYLESIGFIFNSYNANIESVENWKLSAREFLFWTTQNWNAGTLISLSPSAQQIQFKTDFAVVDDVFDTFYDYGIVKADGTKINREFCNINRTNDNTFSISLKNTADGIYAIKLPLVQKEHVVVLDNQTVFKDVIYDLEPGYRQERIRVLGYRTADWTGGLNIPGFLYDEAVVTEWQSWKDYAIGDVVKYKEFYYAATTKITGTETFEDKNWYRLNEKPQSGLLTNLEYKTNQFADFYDLDTDNFDLNQQEIAQHLIGYQKRDYLANIINDDVSQYKFYQGYIADKGSKNALTKLFDALGAADKESLEFYEEWAVRTGQYGASDGFEEIEFLLDEDQFRLSPQPILLTNTIPSEVNDLVYRQLPDNVFLAPNGYSSAPFPVSYTADTPLKTAGYVRADDVQYIVKNKDDILNLNIVQVKYGDYIWVTFENQDWNVYKHNSTGYTIIGATPDDDRAILTLDKLSDFAVGDIIGITEVGEIDGFHKVVDTNLNLVTIELGDLTLSEELSDITGILSEFVSNRVSLLEDANKFAESNINIGEKIWVDNIEGVTNGRWGVITNETSYNLTDDLINPTQNNDTYGTAISANDAGTVIAVGSPNDGNGKVFVYNSVEDGSTLFGTLEQTQTLEPIEGFSTGPSKYGQSVTMSPDGRYIIVCAPEASRVKSAYKDNFDLSTNYTRGSIVQYNNGLYKSRRTVKGRVDNVVFGTFDSASRWKTELFKLFGEYTDLPLITTGDYPLTDTTTDHILVRAPADAYEGSNVGDKLFLEWNDISYNYTPISEIEIVGVDISNPIKLITNEDHNLQDGEEIIITDVPNDNLTNIRLGVNDVYDNSDSVFPLDTIIQAGVRGLEGVSYYVKRLGSDYLELYYDKNLTQKVNGGVGFGGEPNGPRNTTTGELLNPLGGGFNGYIRKINKIFDNQHVDNGIDKSFLVDTTHVIRRKIEEVFYVVDPINVPSVAAGDKVTTATGNATVVYVKNELGRLVIYANSRNGIFEETGELFINDTFVVGEYTRPLHEDVDRSSVLGGYWEIATPQTYNPNGITTATADGLVIRDVKNNYNPNAFAAPDANWKESAAPLPYKNSIQNDLENPVFLIAGTDFPFKRETNLIRNLSYVSRGIAGSGSQDVLDDRWIVRMPKNVSDKIATEFTAGNNPNLGIYLNEIPGPDGTVPGLLDTGFGENPYNFINGLHTVVDIWDGWLDIDFDPIAGFGDIQVGDIIREGNNGAQATVAYYQRDLDKIRIYVKNSTRNFSFGSRYIVTTPPDMTMFRIVGIQSTPFGTLEARQMADSNIGKIAVIQHTEVLSIPADVPYTVNPNTADEIANFETQFIRDIETQIWVEEFKPGLPRNTLVPSTENNDWFEVDNIPINVNRDASNFVREGAFFVYELNSERNEYDLVNGFILPNREEDRQLGRSVKLINDNEFYKLVINSNETLTDQQGKGRIYSVLNGTDLYGTYNWSIGRDTNFKGIYSNTTDYYTDQVVVYNGTFYRALTNLQAEEFDTLKWKVLGDHIDFVGYVPNDIYNEETQNPITIGDDTALSRIGLSAFGNVFDISDNGNVLATIGEYENTNKLIIYRLKDRHFELIQEFQEPENSRRFGKAVSVSDDGNLIAVSAPSTDATKEYQGVIYIYKNIGGTYSLQQILESPNAELTEGFGDVLGFDGDQLVVTSIRGDIILDTTFDRYQDRDTNASTIFNSKYVNNPFSNFSANNTIFDRGFTQFTRRVIDSGVVYVYERINDSLVFGQRLEYRDFDAFEFGKNIIVKNNKILVGLPTSNIGENNGSVAVYNKTSDSNTWTLSRQPIDQVDFSKFRGSFIYDTKQNEMLARLDIIDPIAGKISGFAEQELSYKTYYDPATYNVGFDSVKDEFNTWNNLQVGKLWWDLSTVKYVNYYQGSVVYAQSIWNNLAEGASVDVYEWVESTVLPSRWDELADTNEGIARGISGTTKYGDERYVVKQIYDKISQRFSQRYYFWVKDTKVLPQTEGRLRTAFAVANLIKEPASEGLKFVTILGTDRFILYNTNSLVKNKDVALNFRYWTIDNQENNIHTEYQIISDGLSTSRPKDIIEAKWFDSLIGMDKYQRPVPDPSLSVKQLYGIKNRPRQSMFVNRTEALKQLVERVNRVLATQLIIDKINTQSLFEIDPVPSEISKKYDRAIDTEDELRLVGTVRAARAELEPVVEDGVVTSVSIVSGGRGYRVSPTITAEGTGENLELRANINNLGVVTSVDVINGGTNYDNNLTLTVRPLSALVRADSTLNGNWSIYGWDADTRTWNIASQQTYDVSDYWNYQDWYAQGFSDATAIDFLIDDFYQLNVIDDSLGDIVKITNVGEGGWILLQKIINVDTPDYTVGYQTVGRQNGTIQFSNKLYTDDNNNVELRKILEIIRDDIFVDDLAIEYNKLFFASLRYVFAEQNYVDWAFKTSFIKAKHNVGQLEQRTTFQNDSLASYEEYVKEVKPYKTKIREYLSAYDGFDNTQSIVTDFDLAPFYDPQRGEILNPQVKLVDGVLTGINFDVTEYPARHWVDNFALELKEIRIEDGGSGYRQTPLITIFGGGGEGATAEAFIGNGQITSVVVTNPGSGFTSTPTITVEGTQEEGGTLPKLSAILSNNKVKTISVKQKFDRITPNFETLSLPEVEEFVSSGIEVKLYLKWPMDLATANIDVLFDGNSALSSEYTFGNEIDTNYNGTYTRTRGYISLTQVQSVGTVIRVEYSKSIELLSAADRINLIYNPSTGQYGKDLGQLMDGVDYGGVEVRSFEFGQDQGFDSQPWYASEWDSYDENFEDETFYTDGSTTQFQLSKPLEPGVDYNVYINGIRVDDPNYDGSTKTYIAADGSTVLALGNPNAIMKTITADSNNYTTGIDAAGNIFYFVEIENIVEFQEYYTNSAYNPPKDQVIVIRKSTSDGSFLPEGSGFDSLIEGGNMAYGTAIGLDAADINIDGDGFITPTTSKGPEELVPGQVLDTVDIKVYDRASAGGSRIATRNFTATVNQNTEFPLSVLPHNTDSVFVKKNGSILNDSEYEIDFTNLQVTLTTPASNGDKITVMSMSGSGEQILDIDTFTGDGNTQIFVTNVVWKENISFYITVNGRISEVSLFETDSSYGSRQGLVALQFVSPPEDQAFIYYALFNSENIDIQPYSEVTVDQLIGDGSTSQFELSQAAFSRLPASHNIIVKIDDKILYPGYTQHWYIDTSREYPLDRTQFDVSTVAPDEVDVYINGEKLVLLTDYRWDFANTQVVLFDNVGQTGDDLEIVIPTTSEYSFTKNTLIRLANVEGTFEPGEIVTIGTGDSAVYNLTVKEYSDRQLTVIGEVPGLIETIDADKSIPVEGQTSGATSTALLDASLIESGTTLRLEDIPAQGAVINVYKFSKHDLQDIQMETKTSVIRTNVIIGTEDYYGNRRTNRGLIKLRQPALDTAYIWISVNGTLLTPNRDFSLAKLNNYVQITYPLADGDVVQVIHFAADKSTERFGYRMFKDMLNRTHYKRLNKEKTFVLAEDLNISDKSIQLTDATNITIPSTELNIPGVLFIEGERIEYFKVEGNTLSQLRRGTLGTGAKVTYVVGTELMDQSRSESLPYTDEMVSLIKLEDESTQIVLDWMPTYGVDEFEVFVAGRRLRKSALDRYQFQQVDEDGNIITNLLDQDSPDGDITLEPEFTLTIEGDTAIVNLSNAPVANTRVLIVRKIGKTWQKAGEQLRYASNSVAEFIRGATTDLPK